MTVAAITTAVMLMLGTVTPQGVPNPPRYRVMPDLAACLAAQHDAMATAPLAGLDNVYTACVVTQATSTAPLPDAADILKGK